MINTIDEELTKTECITTFGYGYYEDWKGYARDFENTIVQCLAPQFNIQHTVLEIGGGGGKWTLEYLSPNFKQVICLDVIPITFTCPTNVEYIELNTNDYYCTGVLDDSIDFVWSFGTFCHFGTFAITSYLTSIFQKMKFGSRGIIMFSNWQRNPNFVNFTNITKHINWYYNDQSMAHELLGKCGFKNIKDMIPDFRDSIMYFEK